VELRAGLLIAGLIAVGCAGTAPAVQVDPHDTHQPADTALVTLLEPGSPPRRLLRHEPSADRTTLIFELAGALTLSIGELSPPEVRAPLVRITVVLQPERTGDRITASGSITKVEVLPTKDVSPVISLAVASDLEPLAGTSVSLSATSRGMLQRLDLPVPSDATPQLLTTLDQLRQALRQSLPALPDEPVGTGARWKVQTSTRLGPARIQETVEYTVRALSDDVCRIDTTIGYLAGAQALALESLPRGANVTLGSVTGTGRGQLDLRTDALWSAAELRWSSNAEGTSQATGEPVMPLRMTTRGSWLLRHGP
jgi:hypothetical protein